MEAVVIFGGLNSRLTWKSANKIRAAIWRILDETAYCRGSGCLRWSTNPRHPLLKTGKMFLLIGMFAAMEVWDMIVIC